MCLIAHHAPQPTTFISTFISGYGGKSAIKAVILINNITEYLRPPPVMRCHSGFPTLSILMASRPFTDVSQTEVSLSLLWIMAVQMYRI